MTSLYHMFHPGPRNLQMHDTRFVWRESEGDIWICSAPLRTKLEEIFKDNKSAFPRRLLLKKTYVCQ